MGGKIKIRPEWDQLTKDAAAARNAGMHYGDFVGARYAKQIERELERERRYAKYKREKEARRRERREKRKAEQRRGDDTPPPTAWAPPLSGEALGGTDLLGRGGDREPVPHLISQGYALPASPEGKLPKENGRKCLGCGKALVGRQRVYCSKRCEYLRNQDKIRQKRNARYDRQAGSAEERKCAWCGGVILSRAKKAYCCEDCRKAAKNARRRGEQNG